MGRKRQVAPAATSNDIDEALAAMGADELRQLVREIVPELDDRAHTRVLDTIIRRAARNGSGWAPPAVSNDEGAAIEALGGLDPRGVPAIPCAAGRFRALRRVLMSPTRIVAGPVREGSGLRATRRE